ICIRPYSGLVLGNPVGLGFFPETPDRVLWSQDVEHRAPQSLHRAINLRVALIEPDDRRPERLPGFAEVYNCTALRCDGDSHHLFRERMGTLPQGLAGNPEVLPEVFRMLFGPARVLGKVGFYFLLAFTNQVAIFVEQQGSNALSTVVDSQD